MTDKEINEAVARKLGWEPWKWIHWRRLSKEQREGFVGHDIISALPDYCSSILTAADCLSKHEWKLERIHYVPSDRESFWKYRCAIRYGFDDWASAEADTAPHTICLAFLKLP